MPNHQRPDEIHHLTTHQHWFLRDRNQPSSFACVLDGDRRMPLIAREASFFPSLVIMTLLFLRDWRIRNDILFFSTTEGLLIPCAGEIVASQHPGNDIAVVTVRIRPDAYIRDDHGDAIGVSVPTSEEYRRSRHPRFEEELPWRVPVYVDVTEFGDAASHFLIRTDEPYIPRTRSRSGDRPKPCDGCRNYFGETHGGNKVVCGIHPFGVEGDRCGDWES